MTRRRLIAGLIISVLVLLCGGIFAACEPSDDYNRRHEFDAITANAVFHIERTRLTFIKDMPIDQAEIIEKCGCILVDPDSGDKINILASDLTNGIIAYDSFDLSETGRDKRIKLSFKNAENYIFYDVLDYQVNFYEDRSMTKLWRSVKPSVSLDYDSLDLAVWIDTAVNNYATDEDNRKTVPDKAIRFNGWYDMTDAPVKGRYVLSAPSGATERVINLYADFLSDEAFDSLNLGYDNTGRLVFYGYEGGQTDVLRLPEGVTYIDMQSAFGSVTDESPLLYKSLIIPSTVRTDFPLTKGYNTAGLEYIEVDAANPYYASYSGALYSKNYETLYLMPSSAEVNDFHEMVSEFGSYSCAYWQIQSMVLPESVAVLQDYCFAYSRLTSVAGLANVLQKTGVFLGANVNSYEDGKALYTVLSDEGGVKLYSLSMILDKSITEYKVVEGTVDIAGSAFNGCDKLVSVDIGDKVRSIGASAFSGCVSLKSIKLPASLQTAGENVFYGCTALEKVEGLTDVTYIAGRNSYSHTLPTGMFYNCKSLSEVALPDGLVSISPSAFYSCSSLAQIAIPDSVKNIGMAAFRSSGLTSVTLPSGLQQLGAQVFMSCADLSDVNLEECTNLQMLARYLFYGTGLTDVKLPAQITVIPDYCFYLMAQLRSIDLTNIQEMGIYALAQNKSLTTIVFGSGLKTIGRRALSSNTSLVSVVLPDSVTSIGDYAFASCSKLTDITLGKGLKTLGTCAYDNDGKTFPTSFAPVFWQTSALQRIEVAEGNADFVSIDGILYGSKVGSPQGAVDYGKAGVLYVIPSAYQSTSVTLPDSVKVMIPYSASLLRNVTQINLNKGLQNIGKAAFYASTKITSLELPSTVTNIGASILLGCTGIKNFEILQPNTTYSTDGNLVYEGDKVVMYMGIVADVVIKDGITSIDDGVFMQNTKITSVVIPDSVTQIGDKAFAECSSLTSIKIGKGLKDIDVATFGSLSALKTITVDEANPNFKAENNVLYTKDGRKVVLAASQNGMTSLDSLAPGVREIGDYAFAYHATLSSVVLPEGVRTIGEYSFYECRKIEYIYTSQSLEIIGERAFTFKDSINASDPQETRFCDVLKEVVLYENLKSVGENAFYGHYGIEHVYFKMSYAQVTELLINSGKNYVYLTKGCPSESGERYNVVECSLFMTSEPTIDYDGYSWFYFEEDGKPQVYKKS